MKSLGKRLIALMLVTVALFSITSPVYATDTENEVAPQSSAYIAAVWASATGVNGCVKVDFSITATGPMERLGATSVAIINSSGTIVQSYFYTSTPGMMGYNRTYFAGSVTYRDATPGGRYYAVVGYKAGDSTGSDTTSYTTAFTTVT